MVFPLDIWRCIIPLLDPRDSLLIVGSTCRSLNRLVKEYEPLRRRHWGYLQRDIKSIPWILESSGEYRLREDLTISVRNGCGIMVTSRDICLNGLDHTITFINVGTGIINGIHLGKDSGINIRNVRFLVGARVEMCFNRSPLIF